MLADETMNTIQVNFHEVGRDKRSWSANLAAPLSTRAIAKEAKRGASLMSSCVGAEFTEATTAGEIIVGGFRTVGAFTVG